MSDRISQPWIQQCLVFEVLHHLPDIGRGYPLGYQYSRLFFYYISDCSCE